MCQILNDNEIKEFNRDGAILLKGKFDQNWIEKLKIGINKAKSNPSPRFTNHTKDQNLPSYLEDFWTWSLHEEFRDFVYNSPTAKIASELLGAKKINLVMDNWFFREAGSKSKPPFHHDISYFDFDGSMCVLWIPLEPVKKQDGIAWIKGSHLWDKLFLRDEFGRKIEETNHRFFYIYNDRVVKKRIINHIVLALSVLGYILLWVDIKDDIQALESLGLFNTSYVKGSITAGLIISIFLWFFILTFCDNAEDSKEILAYLQKKNNQDKEIPNKTVEIDDVKYSLANDELIVKVKKSGQIQKIKQSDWKEIINLGNEDMFEIIKQ